QRVYWPTSRFSAIRTASVIFVGAVVSYASSSSWLNADGPTCGGFTPLARWRRFRSQANTRVWRGQYIYDRGIVLVPFINTAALLTVGVVLSSRATPKTVKLLPTMSFTAVAFPLADLQLAQLPPQLISTGTSAFSRNRLGKLGFGERHRFVTHGRERFSKARNRWTQLTSPNVSVLPDGLVASSPICFAAF